MSQVRADQHARLLSLAAHEFRTPASVVGGYLRMLQMDTEAPLATRQRKMVDEAARSCARLVALIDELSDLGNLDAGTSPVSTETFDLFADLEQVANGVHEAEDRGVRLRLDGTAAGAPVEGDRRRLAAAFGALFRVVLREQPTAVTIVGDRRVVTTTGSRTAVVIIACEPDVDRAGNGAAQPFDEYRGGIGFSLPMARRVVEHAGGRIWSPTPADAEDRGLRSAVVVSIPLNDSGVTAP